MTINFAIATNGMIKILEGPYELTEFKFKNSKFIDNNLTFDTEFLQFYIGGAPYINSATEEEYNDFITNVATDILKKILYDVNNLIT